MAGGTELTKAEIDQRAKNNAAWADVILDMSIRGESTRAISRATGVPHSTVSKMITKLQADYVKTHYGDPTAVIGRELALLDSLTRKNARRAQEGDPVAAKIVMEASRDRRKLLGLDAAIKAELTIKTTTDVEIERLVEMLADGSAEAEATGVAADAND